MRQWVFLLVALTAAVAACAKLPPLSVALKSGAVDAFRISLDIDDELRLKGQYVKKYEAHRILDVEQTVLPPVAPDVRRVQIVVHRIRLQTDLAGGQIIRFDSDERGGKIADYHRPLLAMIDHPLTLTLDAAGRVTQVGGFDRILADAKERAPRGELSLEVVNAFTMHYGPDFIADIFEIYYASLPPASKKPLPLWSNRRAIYVPYLGKLAFTQTTKLENEDKPSRLTFAGAIRPEDQEPPARQPAAGAGPSLKVSSGTVKGGFETDAAGRLVRLGQEVVLFLGVATPGPDAAAGQRVTMRTFFDHD
jgi:hypothetical protein